MAVRDWILSNIEMQGYRLTPEEQQRLSLPISFAPAVCATLATAFLVSQWAPGLFALAATAALGVVFPRHPFDYVYGYVLSPVLKTGWVPPSTPQRRFACALGSLFLGGSGTQFVSGHELLGWAVGLAFVLVAVVVATTNWCLPSVVYNTLALLRRR
jgi:hypothetical protein